MRLLTYYIKKRGEFDFDSSRVYYTHNGTEWEVDVTIREWATTRGWTVRKLICTAYSDHRTHHFEEELLAGVPYVSQGIGWTRNGERTWIDDPTRTDHIHFTVEALKSMIQGAPPRHFETEQALREAFADSDSDPDDVVVNP